MPRVKIRASLSFCYCSEGVETINQQDLVRGQSTVSVNSRNWRCMFVSQIFTLLLTFNFLPVLSIIMAIKQYHAYTPWGEESVQIVGATGRLWVSCLSSAFLMEKCRDTGIKGWKLKGGKEQGKQESGEGKAKRFHGERMSSRVRSSGRKGEKDEVVRGKNRYWSDHIEIWEADLTTSIERQNWRDIEDKSRRF